MVASDRVFETRNISVPAGGATVEVAADAAWGTGAYVMATLFRPLDSGNARDPVRAIGLAWVGLDLAPRTLAVAIGAPDKVVPRRPLALPIRVTGAKAGEATFVTVAAVDEGILQLTRFQTRRPTHSISASAGSASRSATITAGCSTATARSAGCARAATASAAAACRWCRPNRSRCSRESSSWPPTAPRRCRSTCPISRASCA
ncbi:MAG: hypothetical protein WDO24_14260 [Pseudomonadota bacterium]